MQTDILIVGGGLSGLSLAKHLEHSGRDYLLVEARNRLGGRILTQTISANGQTAEFDLGPAWFWPGQPRIAQLVDELGARIFSQYSSGAGIVEDVTGQVFRGNGYASMAGSHRLDGGLASLIDGLAGILDPSRIHLGCKVQQVTHVGETIVTDLQRLDGKTFSISCDQVALAVPPRVAANAIVFKPNLPPEALNAMNGIATWMAGQAKVLAVYDRPFWRDLGLSGDAMSHRGPMVEIHDASPLSGSPAALFGFIGIEPKVRAEIGDQLLESVSTQLARLFGVDAADPVELVIQDWAFDDLTATALDYVTTGAHPVYGLPETLTDLWDGRLHLCSTETAPQFGGYLEGSLEAAEMAHKRILSLEISRDD